MKRTSKVIPPSKGGKEDLRSNTSQVRIMLGINFLDSYKCPQPAYQRGVFYLLFYRRVSKVIVAISGEHCSHWLNLYACIVALF
ncbi:hypothetical protein [Reichenbachiella versicolor]|uniref:hypothetical protein n=1 Tax=Reichenbachiella versicolor TaxID=1821036 RepID=UPI000D6EAD71|nr:hypothetical protein [Reichenbachiella versicolor]